MKARDFCFWLQGFFEIAEASSSPEKLELNIAQAEMIQRHLSLVFKHEIDPSQGPPEHQEELQAIHDGKPVPGESSAWHGAWKPAPGWSDGGKIMRC